MTVTDSQVEQFMEMVRQDWTAEATVDGWRKWAPQQAASSRAATDLLLEFAQPKVGMRVLDIAGGTGDPALSLAQAVGPTGHIIVADLSMGMLAAGESNAHQAGLTNLSFQQADAHTLQFPDQDFDLVTCRFGVMFFADSAQALGEIRRVLKPGGRGVFVVWGPMQQNTLFSTALGPFLKRASVPPPPPGAPTPFRYAQEGTLAQDLRQAGFKDVREVARTVVMPWPGTPETLWAFFYDVAGRFRSVMDSLPTTERTEAIDEAIHRFRQFYDGQQVNLTGSIIAAVGVR